MYVIRYRCHLTDAYGLVTNTYNTVFNKNTYKSKKTQNSHKMRSKPKDIYAQFASSMRNSPHFCFVLFHNDNRTRNQHLTILMISHCIFRVFQWFFMLVLICDWLIQFKVDSSNDFCKIVSLELLHESFSSAQFSQ